MNHTAPASALDAPVTPSAARWGIVALLVAYSFMSWFNRVSISAAYDEHISRDYRIDEETIGYVYSAFFFAYMICMTPGGWCIDRFGPWAALVVMGFGSSLFCAATSLTGVFPLTATGLVAALFVVRALMGVCTAPIYPAAGRLVSYWLPPSGRAWANGLVQGAAGVGIALAFPLFGLLMDATSWPAAFAITAAVTLLLALLWTLLASDAPASPSAAPAAPAPPQIAKRPAVEWGLLLRNRSLLFLTVAYAAVGYVEYLFFFWIHYYFEDVLHVGKEASRYYSMILLLAMAAGMIGGGWLSDYLRWRFSGRAGRVLLPAFGLALSGALLLLGVLAEETVWIVLLLSAALAAIGATEAPVWTLSVELGGRQGGSAAAICNTGGNAGGLLAPIVTPAVSGWVARAFDVDKQTGWQWGIALGALIAVCGAVLFLRIESRRGAELPPSGND
ncbi:MAG: MFS transporter [Gemmataceae bacterium]